MALNTYYDNLKVARDAPSDVIRAAYKVHIQKYNADRNPSAEASRLMEIISNSYSVLCNPIQRTEYDQWLLEQESTNNAKKKTGGKNKPGHGADFGTDKAGSNAAAGKQNAGSTDGPGSNSRRWLVYGAIGLAALITAGWLGLSDGPVASKDAHKHLNSDSGIEKNIPGQTTALTVNDLPTPNSENAPAIAADSLPAHDQVAIDKFIGSWKGADAASGVQQSLDISLKSDSSVTFRLDAKAGQSIGGLYGVAEFENGYVRFFNKEYGCSIVFTLKSDTLNLATTGCQAFHRKGASFDGTYMRPVPVKADLKPAPARPAPVVAETAAETISQVQPAETTPVVPKNTPRLRKYLATIQDSEGKVDTIELLAKDKDSARAIIRDFRGNPKVIKIKELKK